MTMTGPLRAGAVQVFSASTGELLGYAFTVDSGRGQTQRWLLFKDPQNALDIRPPTEAMARWTLAEWQSNVARLWRPNSFYVRAQADLYQYGGTYGGVTWTTIPRELPLKGTHPTALGKGAIFQLDPTPWKALELHQGDLRGPVFTVGGMKDASNVEYWMLPANFQPAGGASATKVVMGSEDVRSLDGFVDMANQGWAPGSSFAVIGCLNYTGSAAPATP